MNKDIELFVRLKYQIAAGEDDFWKLKDSYPRDALQAAQARWNESKFDHNYEMSMVSKWEFYINFVFEELCKWEENRVNIR